LFESKRYDWCLFIAHLVIEKVLKAFWVRDSEKRLPWIHNLLKIAEETCLNLSEEQKKFLDEIAAFNIRARYPDDKLEFYKLCTKEFTTEQFEKIKEFYQWLLSRITLEPASKNSFNN
jgi:HEPN domain-containing protein